MSRNIHFVGSIPLEDNEQVFRALAAQVGDRAKRYPDGETGNRSYWIRWQRQVLAEDPNFEAKLPEGEFANFKDQVKRHIYHIKEGVDPNDLKLSNLGYAEAAIASYAVFKRLKEEGVIPEAVKFMVALPTPVAFVAGFVALNDREAVEKVYECAIVGEINQLAAEIPHDQLAIQWDVCYEVVGADGGYQLHYDNPLEASIERVNRLIGHIPETIESGIHLCYGDPGHKHILEPDDFGTSVAFANAISAGAPRSVQWIHMPAPKDRNDDAYFAPLADLSLDPAIELLIGCVHMTDGVEGTMERIGLAAKHVADFGIATECGFGRRDPATIPALLNVHMEAAGLST